MDLREVEIDETEKALGATYSINAALVDEQVVSRLRETLTIVAKSNPLSSAAPKSVCLLREDQQWIHVPRYFGLRFFGDPDLDNTVHGDSRQGSMVFNGRLDPERMQPTAAAETIEALTADPYRRGGVLVMPCGMGKTCVALYCACELAKRTLIVVPTTVLATQWADRISVFCPRASSMLMTGAQRIQEKENYETCDFVITTIHTLSMCFVPNVILRLFGLTIIDEAHGFCAPTFSRASFKIFSNKILSLSATPKRSDGLDVGMPYMLGPVIHRVQRPDTAGPPVQVHRLSYRNPKLREASTTKDGVKKIMAARMINMLAADEERTQALADKIAELASAGRTILVLSERLALLTSIQQKCDAVDIGMLTGKTKQEDRACIASRQVILATYGLCREGFDKASLNTLVMATPITNVEQSVGRILRGASSDHCPLVVEICDNFSIFNAYSNKRRKYYNEQGFVLVNEKL